MKSLDIIIPTYNRSIFLIKNLSRLSEIINDITNIRIKIIISDNDSTDDTKEKVTEFINSHPQIDIQYFKQISNIGFSGNVIFLLNNSTADYVMTLGDDDYISFNYLNNAIHKIIQNPNIFCVLPAVEGITETEERLGYGRDLYEPETLFQPGVESVRQNAIRAHQISGIIFRREGVIEAIKSNKIDNLYPQIFITAWSCLRGACLSLPQWPILATETTNKAWSYDDVGLINDIFQNIAKLDLKDSEKFQIEKIFIIHQRWRFLRFWKNPIKQLQVINKIRKGRNTSKTGSLYLPSYMTILWIKHILSVISIRFKRIIKR